MIEDITLFVTSCNRPDLLKITLESFVKYNTYPIKEAIIIEDSGIQNINDFAYDILPYPCKLIYNPKKIGQMKSIEKGIQYITTPYTFHCEEDWEFYDYGFIEKSIEILKKNDRIVSVWLRSHHEMIHDYTLPLFKVPNENYYIPDPDRVTHSWNPGLRTTEIQKAYTPYPEDRPFNEYELSHEFRQIGFTAAITDNINGYVRHIGWGRQVSKEI